MIFGWFYITLVSDELFCLYNIYIIYFLELTHSGFSALVPQQKSYLFGINLLFAICTSHKIHCVCPLNFCINSVFFSSWVFEWSKVKLKTILMQNFGGQTRCIMGGMHTVN